MNLNRTSNRSSAPVPSLSRWNRRRVVTHLLFWLLLDYVFFTMVHAIKPLEESIYRALLNLSYYGALFYLANFITYKLYVPGRLSRWLLCTCAIALLATFGRICVEVYGFRSTVFLSGAITFSFRNLEALYLFYLMITSIFLSLGCFYQFRQMREDVETRLRELRMQQVETELAVLKAQLNPHFLFNTLNSIYAAATLQHAQTPEMILRLSNLLRFVTYKAREKRIALSDEILQVENYIALHGLKAPGPLPVQFSTKQLPAELNIMPMLLLPLVENALKHGNAMDEVPGAFVEIRVWTEPGDLHVWVRNSVNTGGTQTDTGGFGSINLEQRLRMEYPGKHRVHIEKGEQEYLIQITINYA